MAIVPLSTEKLKEVFDSDPRNDSEIAAGFHVSKQSISAWRNGSRSPTKSKLKEIAAYYHKDIMWFFGFDPEDDDNDLDIPNEEDAHVAEILRLLEGLSDQKKLEAIRYLRFLSSDEES